MCHTHQTMVPCLPRKEQEELMSIWEQWNSFKVAHDLISNLPQSSLITRRPEITGFYGKKGCKGITNLSAFLSHESHL